MYCSIYYTFQRKKDKEEEGKNKGNDFLSLQRAAHFVAFPKGEETLCLPRTGAVLSLFTCVN